MRYHIVHRTVYHYSSTVANCHNEAFLLPRDTPHQRCLDARLEVIPQPAELRERADFFGNRACYFSVQTPHRQLSVTAHSTIETLPGPAPLANDSLPWEQIGGALAARSASSAADLDARGFTLDSPFIEVAADPGPTPEADLKTRLLTYAQTSFPPGRLLLDAVADLTGRIFHDFDYDPHFTTVVTPLATVLGHRRGVCQDFAHLAIACLRALGLPARYVSGYLETLPPPGQVKLQGADASHAWLSVFSPGHGWQDFDPTNNQRADERYITTAWGRDYGDVTPLKGIIFGGGEHRLTVAVDVERLS